MTNKLCLGTAKIGIPGYGYSNSDTLVNVNEFLLESLRLGINCIDTSPRYGDSEKVIGRALKKLNKNPRISTKIDNLIPNSKKNPDLMLSSILSSIDRLDIDCIDVCYLHQNEIDIISDDYVHTGIKLLKNKGLIKEVGTSVYSKEELRYTLESNIFDWVQIPVNILDTSFYHVICEYDTNIKVSVRSVFLQGILLNQNSIYSDIANHGELLDTLESINDLCLKYNIDIKKLSVAYLSLLDQVDQIIVGTTSIKNLKNNILSSEILLHKKLVSSVDLISKQSKTWSNPRHWNDEKATFSGC